MSVLWTSRDNFVSEKILNRVAANAPLAVRLAMETVHHGLELGQGHAMNASVITAVGALLGATVGGLTSVLASWLTQHTQVKAEWLAQDRMRRQDLYKDFIEEASKCYIDPLQHSVPDLPRLVGLYAMVSRMRTRSSPAVADEADRIARKIVDTYLAPDKSFVELRQMIEDGSIDVMGSFSDACRTEFESLKAEQL